MKPIAEWTDDELRLVETYRASKADQLAADLVAEVLRLRADLAVEAEAHRWQAARAEKAEAALAAARAEIDEWSDRMDAMYAKLTAHIRAAIEGDQ